MPAQKLIPDIVTYVIGLPISTKRVLTKCWPAEHVPGRCGRTYMKLALPHYWKRLG